MKFPRGTDVAAVLLKTDEYFVLQKRDSKPNIASPGRLSLFGGLVEESDSSYTAAAARELREETSIEFKDSDLTLIGMQINQFVDEKGIKVERRIATYELKIVDVDFKVFEGEGLVKIPKSKPDWGKYDLAPAAVLVLNNYTNWRGGYYDK